MREERPWGWYEMVYQSDDYWTKVIYVNPGESLSLQYHQYRQEYWTALDKGLTGTINGTRMELVVGVNYIVPRLVVHRVTNTSDKVARFVEVATGAPDETDIIRIHDKYGRYECDFS